jgi:hypothetical protein
MFDRNQATRSAVARPGLPRGMPNVDNVRVIAFGEPIDNIGVGHDGEAKCMPRPAEKPQRGNRSIVRMARCKASVTLRAPAELS